MIEKVIFLVSSPWTERDHQRFGVDTLEKKHGFKVGILDMTSILAPSANNTSVYSGYLSDRRIQILNDKESVARALAQLDARTTFVFNELGEDPNRKFIYRLLSQCGLRQGILTTNVQPLPPVSVKNLLSKLRDPSRAVAFLKARIEKNCSRVIDRIRPIPGVDLWVATNKQDMARYPFPRDKRTEILFGHALDYDLYLNNGTPRRSLNGKTAVFIDQYLPYHPDFARFNIDCYVKAQTYYPALRRFFEFIKENTNATVEVAAHPRSDYSKHPESFAGYSISKGETRDLVARSCCVIAHNTTAVSFAVLYRKPIIFAMTRELQVSPLQMHIQTLSGMLGKKPINIDGPLDRVDLNFEMTVNEEKYRAYRERFIKMPGTPELPLWEIIAKRLEEYP